MTPVISLDREAARRGRPPPAAMSSAAAASLALVRALAMFLEAGSNTVVCLGPSSAAGDDADIVKMKPCLVLVLIQAPMRNNFKSTIHCTNCTISMTDSMAVSLTHL